MATADTARKRSSAVTLEADDRESNASTAEPRLILGADGTDQRVDVLSDILAQGVVNVQASSRRSSKRVARRKVWTFFFTDDPLTPAAQFYDPEGILRTRSLSSRVHLVFGDSGSSQLSKWYCLVSLVVIFLSCAVLVTGTTSLGSGWSSNECKRTCGPVDRGKYFVDGEIDEAALERAVLKRASFADECRECGLEGSEVLYAIEAFCVVIFTTEYLIRLLTCPSVQSEYERRETEKDKAWFEMGEPPYLYIYRVMLFVVTPINVVDALAVVPFWLEAAGLKVRALTFLRLLRVMRIMRIVRQSRFPELIQELADGLVVIVDVLEQGRSSLMINTVAVIFWLAFWTSAIWMLERGDLDHSTGRYYVQNIPGSVPTESLFQSIPVSVWWGVATLSTVGYGDMVPQTALGKTLAVAVMASGVMFMAMPIAILGRDYVYMYDKMRSTKHEKVLRARRGFAAINKHLVGAKSHTVESCMTGFRHWRQVTLWEQKLEREVDMPKLRAVMEQFYRGELDAPGRDYSALQAHSSEVGFQFLHALIERNRQVVQQVEAAMQSASQKHNSVISSLVSKELRKMSKVIHARGNSELPSEVSRRNSDVPSDFSQTGNVEGT